MAGHATITPTPQVRSRVEVLTRRALVLVLPAGLVLLAVPSVRASLIDAAPASGGAVAGAAADACAGEHWVAAWTAAPQGSSLGRPDDTPDGTADGLDRTFVDQTVRMVVSPRTAGSAVRVHIGNRHGAVPVELGAVTLGVRWTGAMLVPGSVRSLTFDGAPSVVIGAGAEVVSDALAVTVQPFEELAVSFHVVGPAALDHHQWAQSTHYLAAPHTGDHAGDENGDAFTEQVTSWFGVAGVDVLAPRATGTLVALGDSITDGLGSSPDLDRRWPDRLAERLLASGTPLSVVNAGIAGNHIATSGLTTTIALGPSARERVELDALRVAGVTDLFVFEGINDVNMSGAGVNIAAAVIDGYRSIIADARAARLRVVGATITPASMTAEKEAARLAINEWIRTSGAYDSIVDFDAVVRDPAQPSRLRPEWDAGMAHLTDAGYEALAAAVDLDAFQGTGC